MKLVVCREKIRGRSKTENKRIIQEFADSSMKFCEVLDYPQKNARVCASSLNNSIRHYKMSGFKAFTANNRVFLIKDTEKSKKG